MSCSAELRMKKFYNFGPWSDKLRSNRTSHALIEGGYMVQLIDLLFNFS